jgi:hypothetical protein
MTCRVTNTFGLIDLTEFVLQLCMQCNPARAAAAYRIAAAIARYPDAT